MKKNLIVSIIIATAAIIAVGLAAYSANGDRETTIHGGKLMAESSVPKAEAEVTTITCRNLDDYEKAMASGEYTYVNYSGALTDLPGMIAIDMRYGTAG